MKHGIFQESGKFKVYVNGQLEYSARLKTRAELVFRKHDKRPDVLSRQEIVPQFIQQPKFHINKRFGFLNKTIKMVASGLQPSAVISGSGGLGKSHSVRKALLESGMMDFSRVDEGTKVNRNRSFTVIKGYSTAKGLFRTLFENNDGVIVFDDCDSVLKDPVALNLLKGALDSYDIRVISWNADIRDPDLPRSFIFTGRVIFISNMPEDKIDQAIRSRSAVVDVSMTLGEVIDRMSTMIEDEEFLPEFDKKIKLDALDFINSKKESAREINLRTLITVCKVRASDTDGAWQEMAEYLICK